MTAVNKQLKGLVDKGYIERSEKDGTWRIIITITITAKIGNYTHTIAVTVQ